MARRGPLATRKRRGQVHTADNAGPEPLEIFVTAFNPVGSPPVTDEVKPAACPK